MKSANLIFPILTSIIIILYSCTPENDSAFYPHRNLNSPTFDTLQGKWKHEVTRFKSVNTGIIMAIIYPKDSCKFNSDLTGVDHFPQTPTSYTPLVNFTYNLLPDDSTLIFNTGTVINPIYDTVIITLINATNLLYKSKPKVINYTLIHGTFIEEALLSK